MRTSLQCLLQSGVHVPHSTTYHAAKMKHWPVQKVPANFTFTEEQRFKAKPMPRDTGKIPRDFVLSVLYRSQPCEVSTLWERCVADPQTVLDSKRHLRSVLEQARAESFISFERDPATQKWVCHLTRERYEEVRAIVGAKVESTMQYANLRGSAATETSAFSESFHEMNEDTRREHLRVLEQQVSETSRHLRTFQRTEVDYLPYTDLNGKVNFMWWYETSDARQPSALPDGTASAIPDGSDTPANGEKSDHASLPS